VSRKIQFIQVTTGESHLIDLEVLRKMMVQIKAQLADFYLVRPSSQARLVRVYPVLNQRSMQQYEWPILVDEIRRQIKQVTVDGWEL
jgi:hypothetical protein